jgi:hypothetical protein
LLKIMRELQLMPLSSAMSQIQSNWKIHNANFITFVFYVTKDSLNKEFKNMCQLKTSIFSFSVKSRNIYIGVIMVDAKHCKRTHVFKV